MTIPRLEAIMRRWDKFPPASVTLVQIARFLGIEPPKAKKEQDPGELQSLLGMGFTSEKPEWLKTK